MRKFLVLLVAVLFSCGIAFASDNALSKSPGAGDIMFQGNLVSDPGKIFRVVRYIPENPGATAALSANCPSLTADSIVVWDDLSDDGVTITTTIISGDATVAGIVPITILTPDVIGQTAAKDLGRRNWGWLQTYGKSEATISSLSAISAAGVKLGTGTFPGTSTGTTGAADTSKAAGFFYDSALASATDVEVFLIND